MAFGIPGITAPPQLVPVNPIDALNPRPSAGPGLANSASSIAPPDRMQRSLDAARDPNAYHDAILRAHGADAAAAVAAPNHVTKTEGAKKPATVLAPVHAATPTHSVADMSLADKVTATTRAGVASAAHDAGGALKTALSDPKTQATLAAGTAVVVGAQFVPGADVVVDGTLGAAGVAMYAASAPEHRDNIAHAASKLKEYAGEVGSAKTQADLDKASRDFADFVKTGGTEAIDAVGTLAGGAAGVAKVGGAVKMAGGVEGVVAGASNLAGKAGDGVRAAANSVVATGDAIAQHVVGGMSNEPGLAVAGAGRMEMRAIPQAIRPSGASGSGGIGEARGAASAESGATAVKAVKVLVGDDPEKLTRLEPNALYEFKGGFTYRTDAQGRVDRVEATLTPGVQAGDRSGTLQKNAGGINRLSTDEGGHLIATRFNGPAHEANHIAQDIKLNRGEFKKLENKWAKDLSAGKTVNVKIDLSYPGGSQRPTRITVSHSVDGNDKRTRVFANEAPKQ